MTEQQVCRTNSGNWEHLTEDGKLTLCGSPVARIVPDARGVSCHRCSKRLRHATMQRIEAATRNAYTLVATAEDADNLNPDSLTTALGEALVSMTSRPTTIGRNNLPATEYRYRLDANLLRDTSAHNMACNRGFLAYCA